MTTEPNHGLKRYHDPGDWMQSPTGEYYLASEADALIAAKDAEIQALRGSNASLRIQSRLIDAILSGEQEFTSIDMEYWNDQHDKVRAKDAEIAEQCRLNAMGQEREARLIAQVAERDALAARVKVLETAVKAVDDDWTEFWPKGPDVLESRDRVCAIAPRTAEIWRQIRAALKESTP